MSADISDGDAGLFGKPAPVRALYVFEIQENEDPRRVLAEAGRVAQAEGWTVPAEQNFPDAIAGSKGEASMNLSLLERDTPELILVLKP